MLQADHYEEAPDVGCRTVPPHPQEEERSLRRLLGCLLACVKRACRCLDQRVRRRQRDRPANRDGRFCRLDRVGQQWLEQCGRQRLVSHRPGLRQSQVADPGRHHHSRRTGTCWFSRTVRSSPVTNNELHANFSLSKDGEYLGLVRPDGVTVADEFAPAFPPQLADISYGSGAPLHARELVGADAPLRYRVPNAARHRALDAMAPGPWGSAATNGDFTVRYYEMNSPIANVEIAEKHGCQQRLLEDGPALPYRGTIRHHRFPRLPRLPATSPTMCCFPATPIAGEDRDNFVLVTEGAIHVPDAGAVDICRGQRRRLSPANQRTRRGICVGIHHGAQLRYHAGHVQFPRRRCLRACA